MCNLIAVLILVVIGALASFLSWVVIPFLARNMDDECTL